MNKSTDLRPRNRGLEKRLHGGILRGQVLNNVHIVFQYVHEVSPVKNIFERAAYNKYLLEFHLSSRIYSGIRSIRVTRYRDETSGQSRKIRGRGEEGRELHS